mmetsp:Transcript_39214/g.62640  ORF Transcript_39214/g.62640 Transcript_39214/m.62640 type:complete len:177 (+) Transcript_39214:35-565(+)
MRRMMFVGDLELLLFGIWTCLVRSVSICRCQASRAPISERTGRDRWHRVHFETGRESERCQGLGQGLVNEKRGNDDEVEHNQWPLVRFVDKAEIVIVIMIEIEIEIVIGIEFDIKTETDIDTTMGSEECVFKMTGTIETARKTQPDYLWAVWMAQLQIVYYIDISADMVSFEMLMW